MRWSIEANEIMSRVPSKQRRQVARDVEKVAKADRASEVLHVDYAVTATVPSVQEFIHRGRRV